MNNFLPKHTHTHRFEQWIFWQLRDCERIGLVIDELFSKPPENSLSFGSLLVIHTSMIWSFNSRRSRCRNNDLLNRLHSSIHCWHRIWFDKPHVNWIAHEREEKKNEITSKKERTRVVVVVIVVIIASLFSLPLVRAYRRRHPLAWWSVVFNRQFNVWDFFLYRLRRGRKKKKLFSSRLKIDFSLLDKYNDTYCFSILTSFVLSFGQW